MKTSGIWRYRAAGWAVAALLFLPAMAYGNPITISELLVPYPVRFILANVVIGILEGLVIRIVNKIEILPCC
jgi:hypothetical protein